MKTRKLTTTIAAILALLVITMGANAQLSNVPAGKLPINNVLLEMRNYPRSLWSFLYPASIVDSGETLYPNETFTTTISVANAESFTLPDSEYSDGHIVLAYVVDAIYDPDGTVLDNHVTELTAPIASQETVSRSLSYTASSTDKQGTYYAVVSLVTQTWDYNSATGAWENTEAYKLVSTEVVKFQVKQIPPFEGPPTGQAIFDIIQNIWSSIWQTILSWLGQ
jgi:hypothetical protein